MARFKTKIKHVTIAQIYAPTEQASIDEKDAFYSLLEHILDDIARSDIVICMGDANAKVGSNNTNLESIMGTHGIGDMNENGEYFTNMCINHDLVNMQRQSKIAKRINVAKLKHEEIRRQYTEELAVNFIQNNDQYNWD